MDTDITPVALHELRYTVAVDQLTYSNSLDRKMPRPAPSIADGDCAISVVGPVPPSNALAILPFWCPDGENTSLVAALPLYLGTVQLY